MDAKAKAELESIKIELDSIIRELEDISWGVRKDFKGIGNEQCANCIDRVISKYREAQKRLNKLDTKTIQEGFGGASSGGGSVRSF